MLTVGAALCANPLPKKTIANPTTSNQRKALEHVVSKPICNMNMRGILDLRFHWHGKTSVKLIFSDWVCITTSVPKACAKDWESHRPSPAPDWLRADSAR
jgi:hypothetical protein